VGCGALEELRGAMFFLSTDRIVRASFPFAPPLFLCLFVSAIFFIVFLCVFPPCLWGAGPSGRTLFTLDFVLILAFPKLSRLLTPFHQ